MTKATRAPRHSSCRRVYDELRQLAAGAIRTFHTGASEEFLLEEVRFKDLCDWLVIDATFSRRLHDDRT